mgnify:CR=1 FL=1
MSATLLLLSAAVSLALTGLFAGYETGLYTVNRLRLRLQLELRTLGSRRLSALVQDLTASITSILIGTNLFIYLAVACVTELFKQSGIRLINEEFAATLVLTPIIFVFAEMLPKEFFRQHADRWSYYFALPILFFHRLCRPISVVLRRAALLLSGTSAQAGPTQPVIGRLGLRALMSESRQEGVLTAYQTAIAANITHLQGKRLRAVMVPLEKAAVISVFAPLSELEHLAAETHNSRFPVYRGDRHQIIGIVNVLEHLLSEEPKEHVAELLRPAPTLKDTDGIYASLVRLRRERMPMGIVQEASGRAIGIVTVKDLVEEIVGELEVF